jgi:hypothetical protein
VLTSRGKPKAAIISIDDYEHLTHADDNDTISRVEKWLEASDELANRIAAKRAGKPFDTDAVIAANKADLEERHDFLRDS